MNPDKLLFKPIELGCYTLPNRIVMAPLTRCRALQPGDYPGPLNAEYYRQRASAGLIIAEATHISMQGKGYAYTPGIYSAQQVEGWKLVTDAVHNAGGLIFLQLWHVGRISHPDFQPDGALPVAPSAIKPEGQAMTEQGFKDFVTPRALDTEEIPGIVEQYRHGTRNAIAAGFDGVEIHAANGYLLDQFLRDGSNQRTDAYGGSIENRVRLLIEATQAVIEIIGSDKTGIRLSPTNPFNSMSDSQPQDHFNYIVERLNRLNPIYLHIVERMKPGEKDNSVFDFKALRDRFDGIYMANGGYDNLSANLSLEQNLCDLVSFGKPYIANPDLVARFESGAELNIPDPDTFYGGTEKGYTDYNFLSS